MLRCDADSAGASVEVRWFGLRRAGSWVVALCQGWVFGAGHWEALAPGGMHHGRYAVMMVRLNLPWVPPGIRYGCTASIGATGAAR